ncbi:unnamed protein product [Protopolystoma xenopodis]|uniref:Uncharacterized protein n=2 Tax=Protopolystoma xenopodis TaxID=117903 RepID=A0A3S5AF39_9PLAT|nr:unnamed protein product [Protopolystoma xenopodis]
MARLTGDADYDAGETSGNVPRPRSFSGTNYADNGLRTRCVPLSLPTNMTKLRRGDTGDAGETSGNVPRPRSYSGNDAADNGPRTRCVPISLSTNMTSFENSIQWTPD